MVFVDQLAAGRLAFLLFATAVHMNLRAGATWPGLTHLPEVVMLITVDDMVFRQMFLPDGRSLVVALQSLLRITLKDGCV